jgi:glyoxylase-like metal-dependent hydrolase (beta-lactamase superfamily II)
MTRALLLPILSLWTLGSSAAAQPADPAKVEIKVQRLGPSVAMLIGEGGNIGVSFGDDGVFLIDDQLANLSAKVRAAVATLSPKPIRFVFNTHWHGDHTGGNEALAGQGAIIVAHDNVRRRLSTEQFNAFKQKMIPPAPGKALPMITFDDELSFFLNGDELRVLHVERAHTDGDAIVFFKKANVVHMGDTLFNIGGYPFIDVRSGGTIGGYVTAADRVLALVDDHTQIIPGHGPVADRKTLVIWRDMLAMLRDRIAKLKAAHKTLAEAKAAHPTVEFNAAFGKGFIEADEMVEFVYQTCDAAPLRR